MPRVPVTEAVVDRALAVQVQVGVDVSDFDSRPYRAVVHGALAVTKVLPDQALASQLAFVSCRS